MSLESLRNFGTRAQWSEIAVLLTARPGDLPFTVDDFETYWIEAGHKIREQIANDIKLCALLRALLPPYSGEVKTLYRGENKGRFDRGTIGLNWTTEYDIARMFAGGLNAIDGGGVLLIAGFPACKIIAGPARHSIYLQEHQFTVEPPPLQEVELLEYFAQS